jgi:transcriptional regulator with XRE-family HTH domain
MSIAKPSFCHLFNLYRLIYTSVFNGGRMMQKNVDKLIGLQIARLRNEREITQEELARSIDVTPETISRLERGIAIPSLRTIEKISSALHTTLKDLFDFEYTQKPKRSTVESESSKLITYLKTRNADDIRMSYRILKNIFKEIDKN